MAEKSRVEIIGDHIKKLTRTKPAVDGLVDLLLNLEKRRIEDVEYASEEIEALKVILVGNGNPSRSLVVRMEEAEETQKKMEVKHEKLSTLVRGKGDDVEEGSMFWQVKCNTKSSGNLSKVSWFSALTILGIILSWIFNLFGIKGG